MEYLSDIEKAKVIAFNSDPIMKEVVRKVILASVYNNGVLRAGKSSDPTKNSALSLAFLALSGRGVVSNEDLGEDLRGLAQGVFLLEQGFNELEKIKDETKVEESEVNNAI